MSLPTQFQLTSSHFVYYNDVKHLKKPTCQAPHEGFIT